MKYNIAVIPGDGIGPEVINEAVKVLNAVGKKFGHEFIYNNLLAGGIAIDKKGTALPDETLNACIKSDSVLLGAVGGPKWDNLESGRPESALLGLRKGLNLFANLRPAVLYSVLKDACPLKEAGAKDFNLDIMIVRELTGGIYFGKRNKEQTENGLTASDSMQYSEMEIERIARTAFEIAMKRNKNVVSIDKANILESSRLWRSTVERAAKEYPDIKLSHMYVDNAAMQLIRDPRQFDVIVTSNMFGDIISDEAAMLTGSIGMLPSASLGEDKRGMYEPVHGSAPDIAGKGIANPLATILSVEMMLRYSFGLIKEADSINNAVISLLNSGLRSVEMMQEGCRQAGTVEIGDYIAKTISEI